VDYLRAVKPDIHVDRISLTADQLGILGCFSRDLRELLPSA
jgi:hypothetical protein